MHGEIQRQLSLRGNNLAGKETEMADETKPRPGIENPQADMMRQDALCSPKVKQEHDRQDRADAPDNPADNPQAEDMRQDEKCSNSARRGATP